ncbi:uncharacterized protein [Elaeis guineensis]|uniref:Uncharacterized protein LOC105037567 n=1 Tax=Elaeis guineensis var. tenera TaxID=51953 RepID=A0A6I9QPT0_ELAGV|nr:uncharacterized protein LOC105037567 [Elaeis guineensis]
MCHSTTEFADLFSYPKERDRLKIRAFYLRLSLTAAAFGHRTALPQTLTLVYIPRISEDLIEVNDDRIPADATAIVALHRVRSGEQAEEVVYASTDRVRAGEGLRFEVYIGAQKALKGVFQRVGGVGCWRMECRWATEAEMGVAAAEVWVAGEKGVIMREKVEMGSPAAGERRRRRKKRRGFCSKLEQIPEEMDGWDCFDCEEMEGWEVVGSDGGESEEGEGMKGGDGLEMEGVRWAVDLGIWVVCLGVGLLVSTASRKGLTRKSLIRSPFFF